MPATAAKAPARVSDYSPDQHRQEYLNAICRFVFDEISAYERPKADQSKRQNWAEENQHFFKSEAFPDAPFTLIQVTRQLERGGYLKLSSGLLSVTPEGMVWLAVYERYTHTQAEPATLENLTTDPILSRLPIDAIRAAALALHKRGVAEAELALPAPRAPTKMERQLWQSFLEEQSRGEKMRPEVNWSWWETFLRMSADPEFGPKLAKAGYAWNYLSVAGIAYDPKMLSRWDKLAHRSSPLLDLLEDQSWTPGPGPVHAGDEVWVKAMVMSVIARPGRDPEKEQIILKVREHAHKAGEGVQLTVCAADTKPIHL